MSTSAAARIRTGGMAAALLVAWIAIVAATTHWYGHDDLREYHRAIGDWLAGQPLYNAVDVSMTFDMSPLSAVLLIPIMALPIPVAVAVMTGLSLLALLLCVRICFAPVVRSIRFNDWRLWTAAVTGVLVLEPVRQALGLGQITLVVLAVVLLDLIFIARRRWWGGIGLGLAIAVQPTFGILILFLLFTRRWRAGLIAAGTVTATTIAGLLVLPEATAIYLADVLFTPGSTGRLSEIDNQALSGVLARLYEVGSDPAITWLGFALFTSVWGLTRARDAHLRGNRLAAVTVAGLTGALVSPVSWTHQFIWIIPAMAVLLWWAMTDPPSLYRPSLLDRTRGRWAITAGFWLWFTISPISWGLGGALGLLTDNGYLLATIALIAILPKAAHRCPADEFATGRTPGMNRMANPLWDPTRPDRGKEVGMTDTATCYERGVEFFEGRDYITAAQWLEPVVDDAPDHLAARLLLARSYYHSARLNRAEGELRQILEQNPAEPYAHLMLGRTLQRLSRGDEATGHMRLAAAMTGGSLDG